MKKYYSKEDFMKLAGIKSRQHLHQLMKGQRRGGYDYPPVLIEGKDFENVGLIFFESAFKKIKAKKPQSV
ncbi:MAG: hypothetical protein HYS25_13865 [Ignavibacteriales bacterium]|nr:hypothetical protein [Ignavibacteriales bacterium]